jgi:protein ImuB
MPGGRVDRSAGPWRSSGAWWTGVSGRWDRDEWDIALGDGTICRLFQQRETGTWFVEGVMD